MKIKSDNIFRALSIHPVYSKKQLMRFTPECEATFLFPGGCPAGRKVFAHLEHLVSCEGKCICWGKQQKLNSGCQGAQNLGIRENKAPEMSRSQGRPEASHTQVLWGRFTPVMAGSWDCCCHLWTLPWEIKSNSPFTCQHWRLWALSGSVLLAKPGSICPATG